MKKKFFFFFLFAIMTLATFAAKPSSVLPQITQAQKDELTRVFLTPTRVVWSNPTQNIQNVECLLKPGDGQSSFYNKDICKITNRSITSFILDFGKEIHGGLHLHIIIYI